MIKTEDIQNKNKTIDISKAIHNVLNKTKKSSKSMPPGTREKARSSSIALTEQNQPPVSTTHQAFRGDSLEPREKFNKTIYSSVGLRKANNHRIYDRSNKITSSNQKETPGRATPSTSPNKYNFIVNRVAPKI